MTDDERAALAATLLRVKIMTTGTITDGKREELLLTLTVVAEFPQTHPDVPRVLNLVFEETLVSGLRTLLNQLPAPALPGKPPSSVQ